MQLHYKCYSLHFELNPININLCTDSNYKIMNIGTSASRNSLKSIFIGFAILFTVYHFHEFYQSMAVSAITLLSFVVISHFVARAQKLEGIKSWGLNLNNRWWLKLATGLALGICFVTLSAMVSSYLGYEEATAAPGLQ